MHTIKGGILVAVDEENNAEEFWDALAERYPAIHARLRGKSRTRLTPREWEAVRQLPGWGDPAAPDYAPHPLVVVDPN